MSTVQKLYLSEEDQQPEAVALTLTIAEAAFVAKLVGMHSPKTAGEMGFDQDVLAVYSALSGSVFNPFWDNGLDGYLNGDKA